MNEKPVASKQNGLAKTGMLPDMSNEISSSRQLRFNSVVEDITNKYEEAEQILMVYFPQSSQPVVFTDKDLVVIGRAGGHAVTLDTTPFHGRELGVSRVHAEISYNKGTYYVRDLKSTNGTWLNQTRLAPLVHHPISAGDELRIGHCLTILHIEDKS